MATNTSKKRRLIYWLCEESGPKQRERARQIYEHGFEVKFFSSISELTVALNKKRVGTLIVGDEGAEAAIKETMMNLASLPDLNGARLILSVSKPSKELAKVAAGLAFSDLIPIDLCDRHWLGRFILAMSRHQVKAAEYAPQIALNHLSEAVFPARIISINKKEILFESRISPNRGASLFLTGAFVNALGFRGGIELKAKECRKTNLRFRFSESVLASWSIPKNLEPKAFRLLDDLQKTGFGPTCRVFLALSSPQLRNHFTRELDSKHFELNLALRRQSIVTEPKFFGPQIVFIEGKLCSPANEKRFADMLNQLGPEVPVYVIGEGADMARLQSLEPSRKIVNIFQPPKHLADVILNKYLEGRFHRTRTEDVGKVHISSEHPFSLAEVRVPSRIIKAHPRSLQLSFPIKVGLYGLCRIESALINKCIGYDPYLKITESFIRSYPGDEQLPYIINAHFCNIDQNYQEKFASELSIYAANKIKASISPSKDVLNDVMVGERAVNEDTITKRVPVKGYQHHFPSGGASNSASSRIQSKKAVIKTATPVQNPLAGVFDVLLSKDLRRFLAFVALSAALLWGVYSVIQAIAPHWERTSVFDESLRKFAPRKFDGLWRQQQDQ